MSLSREITIQGLNMSSPEAGLIGRVVLGFPKPLGVHSLVLPTSSVTLGLQLKDPTVMLNPDRFLYGKA